MSLWPWGLDSDTSTENPGNIDGKTSGLPCILYLMEEYLTRAQPSQTLRYGCGNSTRHPCKPLLSLSHCSRLGLRSKAQDSRWVCCFLTAPMQTSQAKPAPSLDTEKLFRGSASTSNYMALTSVLLISPCYAYCLTW